MLGQHSGGKQGLSADTRRKGNREQRSSHCSLLCVEEPGRQRTSLAGAERAGRPVTSVLAVLFPCPACPLSVCLISFLGVGSPMTSPPSPLTLIPRSLPPSCPPTNQLPSLSHPSGYSLSGCFIRPLRPLPARLCSACLPPLPVSPRIVSHWSSSSSMYTPTRCPRLEVAKRSWLCKMAPWVSPLPIFRPSPSNNPEAPLVCYPHLPSSFLIFF